MMKRLLICTLVLGITIPILAADDDATTITDPSKTGAEYAIQGEYLGKIEAEQGMETWARRSLPWVTTSSALQGFAEVFRVKAGSGATKWWRPMGI